MEEHENLVLITGGGGFLARATAKHLSDRGFRVYGIGPLAKSSSASEIGYQRYSEKRLSVGALADLLQGEKLYAVVHYAGSSSVQASFDDSLKDFEGNVWAARELISYCERQQREARVINASSAAIYGQVEDRVITEDQPPRPVSPYGYHKLASELLFDSHNCLTGSPCTSIRFFSVYGPLLKRQLLWDAKNKIDSNKPYADFWGDGNETRDWLHVNDAVRLVEKILGHPDPASKVNGSSGQRVAIKDLLSLVRESCASTTEIRFSGNIREGDPRHYWGSTQRARVMGWSPRINLAAGVKEFVEWHEKTKKSE